jgi:hypothetical protein
LRLDSSALQLGCNASFYFSCLATRFYSPDAAAVQTHWLVMALLWLFANFIALHSQGFTCFKV